MRNEEAGAAASPVLTVDGEAFAGMIRSAANALRRQEEAINRLNVYPVPDGDTGSNMSMTMQPAKTLAGFVGSVSDCADRAAGLFLRSARGNSGVILSLFFRGVAKGFQGRQVADAAAFREAFACGVKEAYKAIQYPREGTILTVMRVSAESVPGSGDLKEVFRRMLAAAEDVLAKTPDMLPVLKQAGVVDSGGSGFTEIVRGMYSALCGNPAEDEAGRGGSDGKTDVFSSFDTESIEFPYCTECIIDKRGDCSAEETEQLRRFVLGAGDSAVFVDDPAIIKIHVHVKDPGRVLSEALKCGVLSSVKVDNMKNQHTGLISGAGSPETRAQAAPAERYGFVAVVSGDGLRDVFRDLGVTRFVEGGQTMNPSTEQLVEAVLCTPAKTVFLLPDNANICLAANQVPGLISDRKVCVIPSVSVPQGIAAMMRFDPDGSEDENCRSMIEAMSEVKTLDITYAAHNASVNGEKVSKGQILGLVNHKVRYVADDRLECVGRMLEQMEGAGFVTVFSGCEADPVEAGEILTLLREKLPEAEVSLIPGGQPLYHYIISVE